MAKVAGGLTNISYMHCSYRKSNVDLTDLREQEDLSIDDYTKPISRSIGEQQADDSRTVTAYLASDIRQAAGCEIE